MFAAQPAWICRERASINGIGWRACDVQATSHKRSTSTWWRLFASGRLAACEQIMQAPAMRSAVLWSGIHPTHSGRSHLQSVIDDW